MHKLAALLLLVKSDPDGYFETLKEAAIAIPKAPNFIEEFMGGRRLYEKQAIRDEALAAASSLRKAKLQAQADAEAREYIFAMDPMAKANYYANSPVGQSALGVAGKAGLALGGGGALLGSAYMMSHPHAPQQDPGPVKTAVAIPKGPGLVERIMGGEKYLNKKRIREEAQAAAEKIRKVTLKAQTDAEARIAVLAARATPGSTDPLVKANRYVTSPTGKAVGKAALAAGAAGTVMGTAHIVTKNRGEKESKKTASYANYGTWVLAGKIREALLGN